MLFNSFEFIFYFLPITFFIYFYLNHKKLTNLSKAFLVCSSLFFYSWWNILYLPLILLSIVFNHSIGKALYNFSSNAKYLQFKIILLGFGIVCNIALLVYYKYSDFIIVSFNTISTLNLGTLNLALPLAISFFTFQQIGYLVDSYKKETVQDDYLNYALFVTFFPQLIAGPIVHHKDMMSQFSSLRKKSINYKNIAVGLFLFSIGLFKKVVIADSFAVWANAGFDEAPSLHFVEAWITSLSYSFQLYFDFSGYADMAIGLGLLFNIKIPVNFNSPYRASNIQDFWKRWHITLSRFLKSYLYIPMGGNKKGTLRTYRNLLLTFIIGGIWHGAGWSFVLWGLIHGIALVVHRFWQNHGINLWNWLSWLITFNFVNITWVFFRAKNWSDATKILTGMFTIEMEYGIVLDSYKPVIYILLATIVVLYKHTILDIFDYPMFRRTKELHIGYSLLFSTLFLSSLLFMCMSPYVEFIYFNF